jgi:hypothetical protein
MVQRSRLEYVASLTADTGVLAVSQLPLVDRRALNSNAEPARALNIYFRIPTSF